MHMGAVFDPTGIYRYALWREWNPGGARVGFIMLNPSTADVTSNDPTVRRCIGLARAWGYGAVEVASLFAYRATTPATLREASDPVGPDNDRYILDLVARVENVILAWGNYGSLLERDRTVLRLLSGRGNLYCLQITQAGQPRHPLYVRSGSILIPFPATEYSPSL